MASSSGTEWVVRVQAAMTHPEPGLMPTLRLGPWTLEVARGEFVVVLGPPRCGKSSLIRLLAGLLPIAGGLVERVDTRPGIVFSKPGLLPWRSVIDNVMLGAELHRTASAAARERALLLLGRLGAAEAEERRGTGLPPGTAERTALCRALVHNPALLLLDEPFRHVDPLTREQLWLDVQRLWMDERFGVVLATTDIDEAVHLGDRVAVMGQSPGEIVKTVRIELARPRRMSKSMTPLMAACSDVLRTILRAQGAVP